MGEASSSHPTRILVSSSRKPYSYISLAKKSLQQHGEVKLSALGIAITPMVTLAEMLKSRGLAVEKSIITALEILTDEFRVRQKAKLEIVLRKAPDFDRILAEEAREGQDLFTEDTAASKTEEQERSEEEEL